VASVTSLRASDADREQVAELLQHATAEGRLTADELDERLGALYQSRTYGELEALVADLPVHSSRRRPPLRGPRLASAACAIAVVLAVFGMLATTLRHSTAASAGVGAGHPRPFRFPAAWAAPHDLFAAAASAVGVFAVLLVFAAVIWLLVQSRRTSDA
jgi:Domain of unknown function (DUF1707)